ncbi:hypothetical protein POJ06DRAFT_249745 [Lipomyces tetrasporus]|uniref:Uncharacterized protein n=1 Tax=Lipomyces tetrasporus TaxID=54092 RepID=A0AAD7VSC6_9ASCO|nr:uncharacterized protein POJ06DRAFT_249745 [Lipomyces tetrasporus]KAJ8100882.1 hypothetical protein POJ06DRAFT_249745 [Lipomyces tetrasporus]
MIDPTPFLGPHLVLVVAVLIWLVYSYVVKKRVSPTAPSDKLAASEKDAGLELPPEPTPLENLTPDKLKSYDDRPWRPFRWPYHQTMSIFKLDINHWLDMDKWYERYVNEKMDIIRRTGNEYCDCLPDGEDAAEELLETVVDHLTKRYPKLFIKTDIGLDNLVTGEKIDLRKPFKEPPLHYLARLTKEDFYIVKKREDGRHYLVAAVVPAPGGFFGVQNKMGQHLDVIHHEVPYYEEKLKVSMERWFARMKPSDPVERASWFICWDHELLCNGIYALGPGETVPEDTSYLKYNVRVCRQTLRRLPKSQAIIFSNHPIFYSIEEMKDEPFVPSMLKKVVLEGPDKILKYKGFEKCDQHLIPYLDRLIQRQIDLGIIKADDPLRTRPSYPFADWYDPNDKHTGNGYANPFFKKTKDEQEQ